MGIEWSWNTKVMRFTTRGLPNCLMSHSIAYLPYVRRDVHYCYQLSYRSHRTDTINDSELYSWSLCSFFLHADPLFSSKIGMMYRHVSHFTSLITPSIVNVVIFKFRREWYRDLLLLMCLKSGSVIHDKSAIITKDVLKNSEDSWRQDQSSGPHGGHKFYSYDDFCYHLNVNCVQEKM